MSEEKDARRLAEWLAQPPGTAPPPDLNPEVVAAVLLLRPDRAPAPRVDVSALLAEAEAPKVVALPTAPPTKAPGRSRRWSPAWAVPLLGGAFAAAAAAALVVVPALRQNAASPVMERMVKSAEAPPEAPAPSTIPELTPPPPPPADAGAAAEGAVVRDAISRPPEGEAAPPTAASPAAVPVDEAVPAEAAPAPRASGPALAVNGGAAAPAGVPTPEPERASGVADAEERGLAEDAGPPAREAGAETHVAASTPSSSGADEADDLDVASGTSAKRTRDSAAGRKREPPAPAASEAPAKTATSSRTAATPFDYDPDWYRRYPDVIVSYESAAARERAADWAGAAGLYAAWYADPRPDLAQDAAWRGARATWATGRTLEALAVVDGGLSRSSANTVHRAHLLMLRGDLLLALGRAAEAESAWREAAALNADR